MFVAIVVVSHGTVSSESHVGHVPSNVDVEVLDCRVANVTRIGMFTVLRGASIASTQKVANMIKLVQNRARTATEHWKVTPATVAPNISQLHRHIALTLWTVIPCHAILSVCSLLSVGQIVNHCVVNVFWHAISRRFCLEGLRERLFDLSGVGEENVSRVERNHFSLAHPSERSLSRESILSVYGNGRGSGENSAKLHDVGVYELVCGGCCH